MSRILDNTDDLKKPSILEKSFVEVKPPSTALKIWKYTKRAALLSLLAGGGILGYYVYLESHPGEQEKHAPFFKNGQKKKTIVILGSGWGSMSFLKNLDTSLYNVVLVSPRNYFLFTPLLPSCPTGTVEIRSIIEPVRAITRKLKGEVKYLEAEATEIDPVTRKITVKQSTTVHSGHSGDDSTSTKSTVNYDGLEVITTTVDYDYLVMGVGAQPSTFGIPGVAAHSVFLKEITDAVTIRKRLMDVVEAANILPKDDPERKRLLNIVVCGGGPTGVEVAGELQDYIDQDLTKWMPEVAHDLKVTLVEAKSRVLNTFSDNLVHYTQDIFEDTNIDLRTDTRIKEVNDRMVMGTRHVNGTDEYVEFPYGLLIWATGNSTRGIVSSLFSKIDAQRNAKHGLLVDDRMLVKGTDNIYALGDCSTSKYAPTAQVAFQEGIFLAKHFKALHDIDSLNYRIQNPLANDSVESLKRRVDRLQGNLPIFVYNHKGSLAYIGSERAVADLVWGSWSKVSTGGSITFLFWRSAYIYMCLSVKNQILVCIDWAKVFMFGRDCSKE
jgi:NADH:ubiquinone reductase (non-electrogenic)